MTTRSENVLVYQFCTQLAEVMSVDGVNVKEGYMISLAGTK